MNKNQIVLNAAKCGRCGDLVISSHRHDFVSCSCGALSVDGGKDYVRRVFDSEVPFEEKSEYEDGA